MIELSRNTNDRPCARRIGRGGGRNRAWSASMRSKSGRLSLMNPVADAARPGDLPQGDVSLPETP